MADTQMAAGTQGNMGVSGTGERPGFAQFLMGVKKIMPQITDQQAAQYFDDLQAAGSDPEKVKAATAKIAGPQIPQQPSQPVNTQLADPYKGAGYGQADLMKQFNPNQLSNAYSQQQRMYQASQPSRAIGGILAGGSGSADVMNKNKSDWEAIDKQNMLQSIEKQKALQEQATSGLAAGTTAQNMSKVAGEYDLSQQKGQEELNQARQKTQTGALSLQTIQRLNDPASPESLLAKQLLTDQFKASKVSLPPGLDIQRATAQQLMGFMDPNTLNAYKTKVGIVETQATTGKIIADTRKTEAETPGVQAESQIKQGVAGTVAPMPEAPVTQSNTPYTFNFKPGTDLRATRAVLAKSNPDALAAFDAQFPDVKGSTGPRLNMPAGSNLSVSAGGATISPSPATTGGQAAAATEDAANREQSKVSTQFAIEGLTGDLAKQSAAAVKSGKLSPTGTIGVWMANSLPGDSERIRTSLYKLVDAKAAYAKASGGTVPDRDAELQRLMKLSPNAFQNEVLGLNEQVARNEARQQAMSAHIKQNGTATGFDDSKVKSAVYMYNPATGANALVNPNKVDQYTKQGFKRLNELNR